jgi:hypothetical protein
LGNELVPIPEGVLRDVDAVVVNTKELASKSSSVKKGGLDIQVTLLVADGMSVPSARRLQKKSATWSAKSPAAATD